MCSIHNNVPLSIRAIPTGSLRLDIALGTGGIARGQFVEITGPESSGKTTLCQHILAEAQKLGYLCAYIDTDHALDPAYAERCGVKPDQLYISEPEHAEQALSIIETLIHSGEIAVAVLDSVSTLIPQDEYHSALGEGSASSSEGYLSRTLRRLSNVIRRTKTTIIFTNQAQRRVSAVYHDLAENPARLALKLHSGLRLNLRPAHFIQMSGEISGIQVQVQVIKNKFAPCFHTTSFEIMYNNGILKSGEIIDLGTQLNIVNQQGSNYSFRGLHLGTGREDAINHLKQNPSISEEIERIVRQKMLTSAQ